MADLHKPGPLVAAHAPSTLGIPGIHMSKVKIVSWQQVVIKPRPSHVAVTEGCLLNPYFIGVCTWTALIWGLNQSNNISSRWRFPSVWFLHFHRSEDVLLTSGSSRSLMFHTHAWTVPVWVLISSAVSCTRVRTKLWSKITLDLEGLKRENEIMPSTASTSNGLLHYCAAEHKNGEFLVVEKWNYANKKKDLFFTR